ncbi:TPA: hypothetical protein DCW54_00385 [Candidatus Dependentiae bacterium]|nr:hypothetical protein [Candidatus Dependentiae bacterium]
MKQRAKTFILAAGLLSTTFSMHTTHATSLPSLQEIKATITSLPDTITGLKSNIKNSELAKKFSYAQIPRRELLLSAGASALFLFGPTLLVSSRIFADLPSEESPESLREESFAARQERLIKNKPWFIRYGYLGIYTATHIFESLALRTINKAITKIFDTEITYIAPAEDIAHSKTFASKQQKKILETSFVDLPNLIFSGPPGTGKTQTLRAYAAQHPEIKLIEIPQNLFQEIKTTMEIGNNSPRLPSMYVELLRKIKRYVTQLLDEAEKHCAQNPNNGVIFILDEAETLKFPFVSKLSAAITPPPKKHTHKWTFDENNNGKIKNVRSFNVRSFYVKNDMAAPKFGADILRLQEKIYNQLTDKEIPGFTFFTALAFIGVDGFISRVAAGDASYGKISSAVQFISKNILKLPIDTSFNAQTPGNQEQILLEILYPLLKFAVPYFLIAPLSKPIRLRADSPPLETMFLNIADRFSRVKSLGKIINSPLLMANVDFPYKKQIRLALITNDSNLLDPIFTSENHLGCHFKHYKYRLPIKEEFEASFKQKLLDAQVREPECDRYFTKFASLGLSFREVETIIENATKDKTQPCQLSINTAIKECKRAHQE